MIGVGWIRVVNEHEAERKPFGQLVNHRKYTHSANSQTLTKLLNGPQISMTGAHDALSFANSQLL